MSAPPRGSMVLYDDIVPAFDDGDYRLVSATEVAFDAEQHARPVLRAFTIDGPRFNLPPGEVASVYPPRNARGSFDLGLPHVALRRRTLPWERPLDARRPIPPPVVNPGDPPPLAARAPWLALLLFEDGEDAELLRNVPLERVVPADVFARLGSPRNILCDALDVERGLLADVLPSKEELKLLVHVREVNVEDRELATGSGDGFFSVVVCNRLPSQGASCRACLVSLEERSDLVAANPPPEATVAPRRPPRARIEADSELDRAELRPHDEQFVMIPATIGLPEPRRARLVVLHTWQFTSQGAGRFEDLMMNLDVAMAGTVTSAQPTMTDSGHLVMSLGDRAGAVEDVLMRGPLVGVPLTRDPLGPYHSADQARRVSPETGLEDISYAAAFEVGRLLAASDRALAQALMQWRRAAYHQAALLDHVSALRARVAWPLSGDVLARLPEAMVPICLAGALERLVGGTGPIADLDGLRAVAGVAGLDPEVVAKAWGLGSATEAQAILAGAGTLGVAVASPPVTPRPDTTLDEVQKDEAGHKRLAEARSRLLGNAATRLGGR